MIPPQSTVLFYLSRSHIQLYRFSSCRRVMLNLCISVAYIRALSDCVLDCTKKWCDEIAKNVHVNDQRNRTNKINKHSSCKTWTKHFSSHLM